jgi:hypothetical protein
VALGYVSTERAREWYGVVIDRGSGEVDHGATALRTRYKERP